MLITKKEIKEKFGLIKKYFAVEILAIFIILPQVFGSLGGQNFSIEKTCRVNLNLTVEICDNVLLKKIVCGENLGITTNDVIALNKTDPKNLKTFVCWAELESQKQIASFNAITTPIVSIFPIIVILFAGGWTDRHNVRKPCLLFPLLGVAISYIFLIISAIFFDTIPMEYGNFVFLVVPAMFGGPPLFTIAIFSILTETTLPEDRTFRFGFFSAFTFIVSLIATPFTATLYQNLGYIKLFILCDIITVFGLLYLIIFIKEPKPVKTEENETINSDESKQSCIAEFFNPRLALECFNILTKKRIANERFYLIFLAATFLLFTVPDQIESNHLYPQTRVRFNWNEQQFNTFTIFLSVVNAIGPILTIFILNKILKFTDPTIGLIASILAVVSRTIFAFAPNEPVFYFAGFLDLFLSIRGVAMRSIISLFVLTDELGRLYSILGIAESIGAAILTPVYTVVYNNTVDTFSGAFYLLSAVFYITCAIIFGNLYFILKKRIAESTAIEVEDDKKNDIVLSRRDDGCTNEAFEMQQSHL